MRHRLPLLTVLAVAAFAAGCGEMASASRDPATPPTGVGALAGSRAEGALPRTPLVELDGQTTDLASVVRGRTTIVSLWATWCEACAREIPALERLSSVASARGDALVVRIAVGEPHEAVAAFLRSRGVLIPQLVDESFQLADALGERRVPSTLVIDRTGRVVFREGALDAAGLAAFRSALGTGESGGKAD